MLALKEVEIPSRRKNFYFDKMLYYKLILYYEKVLILSSLQHGYYSRKSVVEQLKRHPNLVRENFLLYSRFFAVYTYKHFAWPVIAKRF